jgi:hypothetical protein
LCNKENLPIFTDGEDEKDYTPIGVIDAAKVRDIR